MTDWSALPLTAEHATYLQEQAAITAEAAEARGLRSALAIDDLPPWARDRPWAAQALPALVFAWTAGDGRRVEQIRPDVPVDFGDGDPHKYLWPAGEAAVFNELVPVGPDTRSVLVVEGTKQGVAVAGWVPEGVAVYGIGGCRNWSTDGIPDKGLSVVKGLDVVICLDADVASNPDVYAAAERLGKVVKLRGAKSAGWADIGASGTNGIDDVLAGLDSHERTEFLENLITLADRRKPAQRRPEPKKAGPERPKVTSMATVDRPQVFIDGDRLDVINQITSTLRIKWDGERVFNHGDVLSMLSTKTVRAHDGVSYEVPIMLALDKKSLVLPLQQAAATVRRVGRDRDEVEACYPEAQTVDAILSQHKLFTPLDRIARVPFVRADGTICQSNGYDTASRTLLIVDASFADLLVPDEPSAEDLARAVKFIREEWLVDFFNEMPDDASRANTVGLALTPFIRGLVDVVPLAVVDGVAMGSGKNLLADVAVIIPATGNTLEPLSFDEKDEENRKVITSAFLDGADIFIFDEAHILHGSSLARALTAAYWKDRHLGHNQMLGFANMVTWVALGNNVELRGDILRRVYRIRLEPDHPNPQDRTSDDFVQKEPPRQWTTEHRADVVTALLTLIRAWFAAGQPAAGPTSFGSFERWQRIVGGILAHAGFNGFLANTKQWREEAAFDSRYWAAHLKWLLDTFGSAVPFTCAEAREAMAADVHSEPPPGFTDLTESPRDYHRRLGKAYARRNQKYFGGIRLIKADGKGHGNVDRWSVIGPDASDKAGAGNPDGGPERGTPTPESSGLSSVEPVTHGSQDGSSPSPDTTQTYDSSGQHPGLSPSPDSGRSQTVRGGSTGLLHGSPGLSGSIRTQSDSDAFCGGSGGSGGNLSPSITHGKSLLGEAGEGEAPFTAGNRGSQVPPIPPTPPTGGFPHVNEVADRRGPLPEHQPAPVKSGESYSEAADHVANGQTELPFPQQPHPVATIGAYDRPATITLPPGVLALDIETGSADQLFAAGPDYVRLVGYQTGDRIRVTADPWELAGRIAQADKVVGHNVLGFDLIAYARHHGIDLVTAVGDGSGVFDTKLSAILCEPPQDGMSQGQIEKAYSLDNTATRLLGAGKSPALKALAAQYGGYDRIPLEHADYVDYLAQDVDLTARLAAQLRTSAYIRREHRIAAIAAQISVNGFLVDTDEVQRRLHRNRQDRAERLADLTARYGLPTRKADGTAAKSPHQTKDGKAAIARAFRDLGVELPRTRGGEPGLGKESMEAVLDQHPNRPDVLALVDLVAGLNGVRTVYETIAQHTCPDGRAHPSIGMFQASGRWSLINPGLTVLGKRGGKHVEREVMLPDPGHVIITADLAQVDARALAALSQDEAYLAVFEPGRDLHTDVAVRIWGDETRREDAKAMSHGWNYGMGVEGMARRGVDPQVAATFNRTMREQFPVLCQWRDNVRATAAGGHLLDNGWGRRLRVAPNRAHTQAPALMGQSCARDIMMEGLLRLPAEVLPMLRAVVHDEVVLSVPAEMAADVERTVVEALSFDWAPPGAARTVQVTADLGKRRGTNWGDVYRK